jgi:Tfp pilus assembly protein PilF
MSGALNGRIVRFGAIGPIKRATGWREQEGFETMNIPPARTSIPRRTGVAVVAVALALTLGACSSSSKPGASGTTNPKTTAGLLQKALQEQVAGNLTQAEQDFLQVINQDAKNKFAHYDLGLIYQTQGKNADAETQYRSALTTDPKFEPPLYNLAILRTLAKDNTGAIDLYRRAIASNSKDANAHFNLGLLLRKTGKTSEGNSQVQIAVNLDSSLRPKAVREGVPLQ